MHSLFFFFGKFQRWAFLRRLWCGVSRSPCGYTFLLVNSVNWSELTGRLLKNPNSTTRGWNIWFKLGFSSMQVLPQDATSKALTFLAKTSHRKRISRSMSGELSTRKKKRCQSPPSTWTSLMYLLIKVNLAQHENLSCSNKNNYIKKFIIKLISVIPLIHSSPPPRSPTVLEEDSIIIIINCVPWSTSFQQYPFFWR